MVKYNSISNYYRRKNRHPAEVFLSVDKETAKILISLINVTYEENGSFVQKLYKSE